MKNREILQNQLIQEARHNPGKKLNITINDPKYQDGQWEKKLHEHTRLDGEKSKQIHYWENLQTGERHGFKFKDDPN